MNLKPQRRVKRKRSPEPAPVPAPAHDISLSDASPAISALDTNLDHVRVWNGSSIAKAVRVGACVTQIAPRTVVTVAGR